MKSYFAMLSVVIEYMVLRPILRPLKSFHPRRD
jgi:hypothetical protein